MAIYYQNEKKISIVTDALKSAKQFMAFLKPYNSVAVYKKGGKIISVELPTTKKIGVKK
jgi:hypothetical protein